MEFSLELKKCRHLSSCCHKKRTKWELSPSLHLFSSSANVMCAKFWMKIAQRGPQSPSTHNAPSKNIPFSGFFGWDGTQPTLDRVLWWSFFFFFFSPQPLNLLPTYPYLPHFSSLLFPFPAHHFLLHLLFFFLSPFVSLLFHSLFSLVLCFFLFLFVFVLHLFLCFLSLVLYVFTLCVKKELWK